MTQFTQSEVLYLWRYLVRSEMEINEVNVGGAMMHVFGFGRTLQLLNLYPDLVPLFVKHFEEVA